MFIAGSGKRGAWVLRFGTYLRISMYVWLVSVTPGLAYGQLFKPRPPVSDLGKSSPSYAQPPGSPLSPTSPQSQSAGLFSRGPMAAGGSPLLGQFAPDGPAPYWLKEGIRLTYYVASASIPATAHYYYPDEHGNYVDDQGNRYNQGDNPGPAGHGISQMNIACVDGNQAIIQARSYGYTNGNGPLVSYGTTGYVAPVSSAEWWMSPTALQAMVPSDGPGMKVLRMPWTVAGKTYKAIAFKQDSRQSRSFSIYDTVTGLLLTTNTSSVAQDGRQNLAQIRFMDWRMVRWPWADRDAPGWVAQTTMLKYQGTYSMVIPGSPEFPVPLSLTATFKQKARRWASYQIESQINNPYGTPSLPNQVDMIAGPSIFGGLWIDPAALGNLRQGQILDQDRLAGTTVTVTGSGPASVEFTESGQIHRQICTYDRRTGILSRFVVIDDTLHTTQTLNLVR